MYKGIITTATTATANTNVPFTTSLNTNQNTTYSTADNAVKINTHGYYDIGVQLYVTNVAVGNISVQLFADGTAIAEAIGGATSGATTDVITLTINDILQVKPTIDLSNVEISVRTSVGCTINSGVFSVERRK